MEFTERMKSAVKALIDIGAAKDDSDIAGIREYPDAAVWDYFDEAARFEFRNRLIQPLDRGCVVVIVRSDTAKYHMIEKGGVWHARHIGIEKRKVLNKRTGLEVEMPFETMLETPLAQYRTEMLKQAAQERARRQGKLAPAAPAK